MNDVTRILIVEDLPSDFELAQREIRKAVKNCRFQRVEKQVDFLKALDDFQPDLIVSDYMLPSFDGMKVLKLAQKHSPSTPIIIWTGSMGENTAVECIKKGASNYILKENLQRLGPAVIHALEERNLLLESKRAEEKYRVIFENSMEGIFQSTPEGHFLSVNPAMARIYGYNSPAEMMECITDISSQIYAEEGSRSQFIDLLHRNDVVENFEMKNLRKDGSIIWTSTSARTVRDETGTILYYEGFLQDITARKQADERLVEAEKRFRALIENALDNISLLAKDGTLLWENPAVNSSLGYKPREFIGRNIFELLHPDDQGWVSNLLAKLTHEPRKVERGTFRLKHSDGTWRWNEGTATNMLDEPGVNAIVVNYHDITERREAEEKLRESEEKYRLLFENNPLPMWIYDLETLAFLKVNDAAVEHYGYTAEEFMAMTIKDIRPSDDVPRLLDNIARLHNTIDQAGVWRHCKKDGAVIQVEIVSHPVEFASRKAELVLAIDVTERIQTEDALRESQAKYQNLVETSHDLIWSVDPEGRFTFVNGAAREIYGYEPEELIGRPFFDILDVEHYRPQSLADFSKKVAETSDLREVETYVKHRDGRQFILSANSVVLRDAQGRVTGITGSSHDITLRKRVEEVLKEERNLLRTLIDNLPDRIYAMDAQGRKTLSNKADWLASGGKSMEDVIGKTDFEIYPAELAEGYWLLDKTVLDSGQAVINHEEPGRDTEGNQVSILTSKIPLQDENGKVTGLVGIGRDITERKQAEARLNDLLEFNEKILHHSPLGILTYRLAGECVFANHNAAEILGATVDQLKAQNFHNIASWQQSGLYDLVNQAISTRSPVTADIHHISTFGSDVWIKIHCVTFMSKEEEHLLLSISNITDRRLAEDKLRESENRLILALSAAQMSVWEWNLQTNDILWSPEFYSITGIKESAFDGTFEGYTDLIHPQDVERVRKAAEQAVAENALFAEEFRIIRPDGEVRWLSNLGHAEYGRSSSSLRMIGTVQDITQRKQVEIERQALLEIMQGLANAEDLQEFLALIHRSIGNVIYAENFFVVFHNRETGLFEEIYSVDQYDPPAPPSSLEKSITSYVFRTSEPLLLNQAHFDELVSQGEVELVGTNSASWLGVPLKTSNGTIGVIVVQDYENPYRYSDREKNFLASIATQVALAVERKQAEMELQQKNDDLGLLNAINQAVIRGENLDSVVELLAKELSHIFETQGNSIYSTIYMLSPDKQSLRMQKYFFAPEVQSRIEKLIGFGIPAIEIPIKEGGYFHRAMISRQSTITTDPQTIQNWISEFVETKFLPPLAKPVIRKLIPQIHKLLNINSTIVVPLISEEEIIGFLDVSGPIRFTPADLKRIEAIGGQLTAVIQRQQANEKIRRSEEFLQSIQNALSASIAILNEAGTIVQVNSAWREFGSQNGLAHPQDCVGLNYLEICDAAAGANADEAPLVAQAIRAVLAGQKNEARIEYPCHGPDTNRWFTLHVTKFEDGDHKWVVLAHENITEQKLAEMTLIQSQARYRDLFDSSPVSLWEEDYSLVKKQLDRLLESGITDLHRYLSNHPDQVIRLASLIKITDVNQASLKLAGTTSKELVVDWLSQALDKQGSHSHFGEEILGLFSSAHKFEWDGMDETLDGRQIHVVVTGSIPRGYEEDWSKVIVSMIDITERKRVEEAEREQRALAEALRDTAETLNSTLDYGQVLDQILNAVGQVVPHDAASIMLLDQGIARVVRSQGYAERGFEAELTTLELPLSRTSNLQQIVERRQPVVVPDTRTYPGWNQMAATAWLRSNVGAPISIHGKVIGFILLDSETAGFFSPVHAERLEAFANQAALAIHNANVLQQAQEEIAERKRAEAKLRISEERFRQMAENIEEVFWMTDAQTGAELYLSPASEKVWGRSSDYLMKETGAFIESIHPDDQPLVLHALERERNGEKVEVEYRITRPDGTVRWVWDRAFPVFDENGKVKILAGIAADVTERKQAEEALRFEKERFEKIVATVPGVVCSLRQQPDGSLFMPFASPSIEDIYGVQPEDVRDTVTPLLERIHPEDAQNVFLSIEDSARALAPWHVDFRYQHPVKGQTWIEGNAMPIRESDGSIIWHGLITDITGRKQAEQALQESEKRFSNAFEFAPIGIALVSLEGRWLKVNHSLCDLLGYTEAELIKKTFQEVTHPEDLDIDLGHVQQMLAGSINSYQMEKRYIHQSGNIVWVLLSVSLVKNVEGKPQYFISQIEDISQRKRAEQEISRRAKETSALLETSLALTNLDLQAILHSIGNSAKSLFAADGCRIFLMQPDGESLRCVLALQENFNFFSDLRISLGFGVTGSVAANGKAEIVNAMQNDPRAEQVPGTVEEEEAIMFAPLKERERTIGVLSVRRAGSERPFEPADLELLEAFASMAASAVSNARLFEEAQRRLSELEALYENGLAVGQLLEPRQIGERIIETFARHLSWHHVAIRLLRPGTSELELIAFNQPGMSDEERADMETHVNTMISRVGQGISGWVVQTGKPIRTGNVQEHPQYVHTYQGIQSGLYMPLRVGERVIGVISVESEESDALTAQDERLLATLANQAAVAFENARLYQSAQQEITERKRVERELRESQERYQLLVETSPDGVILLDMDGMIRFSNTQMAGLFHLDSPAELLGTNVVSLFAPEEREHIKERVGNDLFDDTPQEGRWLMRKDGSRFFGELRSSTLRNEKDEQYAIMAQLRDMTERKQAQEALQEERQRFLDLFENSPNPTWLEDFSAVIAWMDELRIQGVKDLLDYLGQNPEEYKAGVSLIRILNVNHAAVITNGAQDKHELINKVHELMLDDTPSQVMIYELDMIWKGNTAFGFEMTSHKMDGSPITGIQRIYIPTNNNRPDYARVIVTSTDITERVEIEQKLRASELHYRELADSITDILFELDHELRYTHWNRTSERLMGIPAYEAIGKSMYEVFGESEEQTRIGKIYLSVLEENQPKTFETEIPLRGQKVVFEINANPSMRGVSVVARNITERKLSETLMQKRFELVEYSARHSFEEVLQKTIDVASELTGSHIGFMHFIEDDQTTINLQAWSTETLQAFCRPDLDGFHSSIGQAGVWADAVRQRRSTIHNDYISLEDKKGLPEGHAQVIREMVIPIIRNEKVVAVMGVGNKELDYTQLDIDTAERFADYAWDIAKRKQMESALAEERNQLARRVEERTADLSRANSNLARALRVKDEFLANMSHELRTPLNAILGLSESLGEQVAGPLNEKQQKYLSTINESGHHLLSLINDILDLAKIEAGQITLDINKVDVNSVCQASLRMIKQLAQKKNQEVIFEIDNDLGLMWADERRLKQMIVNLLSNAVKFTPESCRIGLEVRGDRAANKVIITVWDTGIGIKEQDLERLFRPFVQLDSGLAREATGTGLGLALVAQMARLHGGSVHALSKPGEGSRFIIQLPWEPAMASDIVARLRNTGKFRAIDTGANRPTILLIEDTREVVMMLVDYLEMAGYKMVTAQDGIDGLAQAKLMHPDLILMDIQMPRMDGFETAQKLRSDPEFKDIPIIALTALAMPNDRQRCLDAGMDEYMSKPVNLKALAKTIQKLLIQEVNPT